MDFVCITYTLRNMHIKYVKEDAGGRSVLNKRLEAGAFVHGGSELCTIAMCGSCLCGGRCSKRDSMASMQLHASIDLYPSETSQVC